MSYKIMLDKAMDSVARKPVLRVGELLLQEDALYVTGEIGNMEVEWLL